MVGVTLNIDTKGIGVLSIDRPHVRNALDWDTMEDFADAVESAHVSPELKVLIITGAGRAFVSGGDLSVLQHYPKPEDGLRLATIMGNALSRLEMLPCMTIAAINGPARGGGAEVAIACDMRVISETADVGFVHTRLGIVTAWGGGQRLMRAIGYGRALELLTTGRVINAAEALAMGIANRVRPDALSGAFELAGELLANPSPATQAVKRFLKFGQEHEWRDSLMAERAEFPELWDTEYRRQAMAKFLNRKKKVALNGAA